MSTPARARDPKGRSIARRRALEILHAADVGEVSPEGELFDAADALSRDLVAGVAEHREAIDARIGAVAEHWSMDRMPVVDRNVLRLATYELLFTDVPAGAVVDEAVRLAKLLSTEESGRFVNGILGRIARER